MRRFLEAIEENAELKSRAEALRLNPEAKNEDFIALAHEYGIELTEEDLAVIGGETGELADDEVEMVSGGTSIPKLPNCSNCGKTQIQGGYA